VGQFETNDFGGIAFLNHVKGKIFGLQKFPAARKRREFLDDLDSW